MQIAFRPAKIQDFDFCRRLYFGKREDITHDQETSFLQRWKVTEVRVITCNSTDVGWLQSREDDRSLFLVQLFIEEKSQGNGIGADVLKTLINEAAQANMPMTLGVVKSNPARRLYERLGFKITHEDDRKFYMKIEPADQQR